MAKVQPVPALNSRKNPSNISQNAHKSLARANAATLTRTHLTTLALHAFFILYRLIFRRGSITKYLLLSVPSLLIEFYLERLGRPVYSASGELRRPGEDLAAKGITEYAWDIVYVTWICLVLVGVAGEWAWWVALVVPLYGSYLAWGLWRGGLAGMMPGMAPPAMGEEAQQQGAQGQSKRQAKMEKRGAQAGQARYR